MGYDSLWIYDGTTTSDPLIGGYSGTTLPPVISSTGPSITLEFYSDGATRGDGWKAIYSCIKDTIPPTTILSSSPSPSASTDFTSTFTDADNVGGSGVMHQFYQVADFNTTEWRSNNDNGFFNDNFETSIHTDWIDSSGIWNIAANQLQQSDENNPNTNIYAGIDQTLATKYLYHFKAAISGSGSNKRAGIHYMCDDASQSNRGNSYFVWFRQDDAKLQFYKVINNTFTLEKDVVYNFNATQQYDYKIVYDQNTGTTEVYVDDEFIDSWQDASPLTSGNAVSFRSGNCVYEVDEFRVYKSRTSSELITVGPASTNDIRYENNPTTSGKIRSLVIDTAHNVSTIAIELVDVDFSATDIATYSMDNLRVYPNPATNEIIIETEKWNNSNVVLTTLAGKVVREQAFNSMKMNLSLEGLAKGVYLLRVGNYRTKLIKH